MRLVTFVYAHLEVGNLR